VLLADDSATPPLTGLLLPHRLGPHCLELPRGARTLFTAAEHAPQPVISRVQREDGSLKEQLWLMLFEQFQHPNGQLPAYEWEFSDLNPPVHAWAVWRVYNMDRIRAGRADTAFLEKCFHKLLLNFTWWVNKVDRDGNNVFEGGFLGLDNITVFDRSDLYPAVRSSSRATPPGGWACSAW